MQQKSTKFEIQWSKSACVDLKLLTIKSLEYFHFNFLSFFLIFHFLSFLLVRYFSTFFASSLIIFKTFFTHSSNSSWIVKGSKTESKKTRLCFCFFPLWKCGENWRIVVKAGAWLKGGLCAFRPLLFNTFFRNNNLLGHIISLSKFCSNYLFAHYGTVDGFKEERPQLQTLFERKQEVLCSVIIEVFPILIIK